MSLAGLTILTGLLPLANVFLTREVVDALANLSQPTRENVIQLIGSAGALVGFVVLSEILFSIQEWVRLAYTDIVSDEAQSKLHALTVTAPYSSFEDADYQNKLSLASSGAETELTDTIDNLCILARSSITLITMIVVIAQLSPWLPLLLATASLPTLWLVITHSKRLHAQRKELVPAQRHAEYYDWLMQAPDAAAELRIYRLGSLFQERYRSFTKGIRQRQLDLRRQQLIQRLGAHLFGLVMLGGAMALVLNRAIAGLISIGQVAMFYRTIKYSQDVGIEFVKGIGNLYRNSVFLSDYFQFLDQHTQHEPNVAANETSEPKALPLRQQIEFRKVSFTYPNASQPALRDCSLIIPAGKTTAILGPNGSGKSTLLKLLSGLYTKYDGSIFLDDKELGQFPHQTLHRSVSVLFQDPMEYHTSVKENVLLTQVSQLDAPTIFSQAISRASAGMLISRLPQHNETLLGKWLHKGHELSGGEWQRIAIARAASHGRDLVILDEPTSAMDPWSEIEWSRNIIENFRGKTLIIITHRVAVAQFADNICVMQNGQVVERGTHQSLLETPGHYAKALG